MLSALMGSKNVERILLFLLINEKCYGMQLHRLLNTPLTPIQKGFSKLEKAGVVQSLYEGKTRYYRFNPMYPLKKELEGLLRKAYELLPVQVKRGYYIPETVFSKSPLLSLKQSQEILLECWARLKSVEMLETQATLSSDTLVKQGTADVKVITEGTSVVHFHESGVWQLEKEKEIQFSNTLRWTLDMSSGTIALEHLRHGAGKPVFLFHLKPKSLNLLVSIDSHLCGSDAYFGQVQLGPHYLQLSWKIVGPKKNDRIESLYSHRSAS
jgi:predicted transcriptional regulator